MRATIALLVVLGVLLVYFKTAFGDDKYVTVAVIDTGLDRNIAKQGWSKGICRMGHKDFTGTGLHDMHGHGTNISGLIHHYAKGTRYCQVILKYYLEEANSQQNLSRMKAAIKYAVDIGVDVINISGGGPVSDSAEKEYIKRALDKNIIVVTAAGNDGCKLGEYQTVNHPTLDCTQVKKDSIKCDIGRKGTVDGVTYDHGKCEAVEWKMAKCTSFSKPSNESTRLCDYYPAMYDDRIVVVGNGTSQNSRVPSSNWGTYVDSWFDGMNKSGEYGSKMGGTSQATAIQTGIIIRDVQNR